MSWKKNTSEPRSSSSRPLRRWLSAAVLFAFLAGFLSARDQEPADGARSAMAPQGDPITRARAFPRYGETLIRQAREAARNSEYEKTEKILTEYRDAVKQLHEDLRQRVSNPEKKPNGFKQLQIHVRRTLKELDDIVAAIPANLHPPFKFLQKEIEKVDRALIEDLFPRRPGKDGDKGKT